MDTLVIAIAGAAVAVSWLVSLLLIRGARRRRLRSENAAATAAADLAVARAASAVSAAGEREAAWAARTLAATVDHHRESLTAAQEALAAAEREATARETALDALGDELRATTSDLADTRRDLAAATRRLAELETELVDLEPAPDLTDRLAALESELAETRASVALHASEARDLRHRLEVAQRMAANAVAPEARPREDAVDVAELRSRITELELALAAARDTGDPQPDTSAQVTVLLAELDLAREAMHRAEEESRRLETVAVELRARVAASEVEAARVTAELDGRRSDIERLRAEVDDTRREADSRIAAAGARIGQLEAAARTSDRESSVLVARDATISDLEQRLGALTAARTAELRRLNDKIASMERLYVEVEVRDRRITTLEEDLKESAESRDAALSEVVRLEREVAELRSETRSAQGALERFAGIERELVSARARITELDQQVAGSALGQEVERLRRSLDTERERADRATQRTALGEDHPTTYAAFDRALRDRTDAAVAAAVAPLQDRIDHLHAVVVEKEHRIAALTAAAPSHDGPDDLTRIRGIGPKIASILHDLGITTFRDIAAFTDDDVQRVGGHLPVYGGRIVDDSWIEQARSLAVE